MGVSVSGVNMLTCRLPVIGVAWICVRATALRSTLLGRPPRNLEMHKTRVNHVGYPQKAAAAAPRRLSTHPYAARIRLSVPLDGAFLKSLPSSSVKSN